MLEAGYAKTIITPPAGARLAGFAARQDVCRGVHDDLHSRALVLRNDTAAVALVSVDVLALPAAFVDRVREGVARRTSVPAQSVLIASTHTHGGPVTITTFFNPDETVDAAYMDTLAAGIEESVALAWESRFPAKAGLGSARMTGLGVNRRTADGKPIDDEIGILRVEDASGRTRAVLVNYACHPTVLGPDNLLATADFPGATVSRLESALGEGSLAMFVNGTQGNIGPGHSSELSAIGIIAPGRTYERAAELGEALGSTVAAALPQVPVSATLELGAAVFTLVLPMKPYPPAEESRRALENAERTVASLERADPAYRAAKTELLYASIVDFYAGESKRLGGALSLPLQAVRIGDAAVVALPAEVFVEIGLRIKQSAPHRTYLAGVANGYIGYFPDRKSYPAGGYEVVSAKVDETAEDRLVSAVLHLEEQLFA
jgi:hypothetical protein